LRDKEVLIVASGVKFSFHTGRIVQNSDKNRIDKFYFN